MSLLIILISCYILYESLDAITRMPEGIVNCFCHKVKYVLAFGSAIAFIYYALVGESLWLAFGSAGTVAMFCWPRMAHRFNEWKQFYKELEELEGS